MNKHEEIFDIRDYCAIGDGKVLNTATIQAAIDDCHKSGGGTVWISAGKYVTGTIYLKDNVYLRLADGAELLSSLDMEHFPSVSSKYRCYTGEKLTLKSIIYAENASNIGITGTGAIDGRVNELDITFGFPSFSLRPRLIHLRGCKNILIQGITLQNSATWVQHYKLCEDLHIEGVKVNSRQNKNLKKPRFNDHRGMNQDGLDIDSCRNVFVNNCHIYSGDDGICLKSRSEKPCENVVITNCIVSTNASAIKLGTESNGGYRNININNCVVYDTRITGIGVMEVDGGICENININNISMNNIMGAAIFIRLNERSKPLSKEFPPPGIGEMRNVRISNITATNVGGLCYEDNKIGRIGCSIVGTTKQKIKNISLQNIDITFIGGSSPEKCLNEVLEYDHDYPNPRMYQGDLPAYGFFCRHVDSLRLESIDMRVVEKDTRPPVLLDKITHGRIVGLLADTFSETETLVKITASKNINIVDCMKRINEQQ
jgi:polygalacturonase